MKRLVGIIGIVLLIGVTAAPLMAHGPGWERGDRGRDGRGGDLATCPFFGNGYARLTDEQRTKLDTLNKQFYDETALLRNELRAKRYELNSVLNAVAPDATKAKAVQKEISDIQAKLADKRIEFEVEVRKINPDVQFDRGYGHPMRDYGHGKGRGWHRGGYGPGTYWN